jgi:hypothetical protein
MIPQSRKENPLHLSAFARDKYLPFLCIMNPLIGIIMGRDRYSQTV